MNQKKRAQSGSIGISLLDVIILILIVGVIAALVIPKARLRKTEKARVDCRTQLTTISDAMMRYFSTSGDTSLLNLEAQEEPVDSADTTEEETEVESEEEELSPHLFTDDTTLLRPYLSDEYSFTCPLDDKPYVIIARDSIFYSISCPNNHGQVINGQVTWEE